MTHHVPLLGGLPLARTVAWQHGQAITAGALLADAQVLAKRLPGGGQPVNLCADRYLFAVGLLATGLRGQACLLPPNALPSTLQQLCQSGLEPYALVDDPAFRVPGMVALLVARNARLTPEQTEPQVRSDLLALVLMTSGSTGQPTPHAKSWGALQANIAAEARRLAELLQRPSLAGVNLVATVPPQHSYGLESSVLLALFAGAAFDCGRPFYPADIAEALFALPGPRALVTTPFHLKALVMSGVALPEVALVLSATAPLSPQLAAHAEAACNGKLIEIYGCTEAGQVAARRTTEGEVWATLPNLRLQAQGDEFIVRGGHVEQATALADVLELIDEQHFRLLGRANDLIHVAGKRSSLAHLNFHLNRVEGVQDGAFWLPEQAAESVVRTVAFVVAPGLSSQHIIKALRGRFEPAFLPRRVVQVAALPREATGKLTAQALHQFALTTLARRAVAGRDS